MLYFSTVSEAEEVFKALSAPMRLQILNLLYKTEEKLSMNDLAEALGLTNSAISMHVSKLEQAGLVKIRTAAGKRGNMKIVRPVHDRMIIDFMPSTETRTFYEDEIPVGYFTNCKVTPTCGIATSEKIVGELDDPRYFTFPDRFQAGVLWFSSGYIEYSIPNRLQAGQVLTELQLSFEISSEFPEFNDNYPSDIYFSVNDTSLGHWISPGDYGDRRGFMSPAWWPPLLNQYGLLKTLIINSKGTFVDGDKQISDTKIDDLQISYTSPITLRFEVPKDTANCGGITLFGKNFGDYNQAIKVKAFYRALRDENPA